MKRIFITGLVLLLPLTLTLIFVLFLFNLLTDPFAGAIREIFNYYGLFQKGFWFLSANELRQFISKVLILILLFLFTVLVGIVGRWFFVHYLIRVTENIFHQIPLINSVYNTSKDVIQTIFTSSTKSFKQVVFVPFPNEHTYSLGLITRENLEGLEEVEFPQAIAVFVPTTPNPTSGFLMLFASEQIIYLDMHIEDALKYTISCGVVMAPFKAMSREEALEKAEELKKADKLKREDE